MPRPLSLAIVTQAYHPAVGGVSVHVEETARGLRRLGHRVTIVTAGFGPARGPEPGIERIGRNFVVRYNGAENNITMGLGLRRRLAAILDPRAIDLVHIHCPLSPVLPLLTLRAARQPVVGTFHSTMHTDFPLRLFRGPLRPYFRRIDRALAVSESARELVTRHFSGPVEIVPNGVDLDRFRPGLPRIERFADGTRNVLFVGRHDPRKGLPDLVDACARLASEGTAFRLIIVGDGALRARIERRARSALGDRAVFVGSVSHDELPRYYASADVFCSPARGGESFGMVLLEAMASGLPVVASDLPGYRTVVTDGVEGLMPPPKDAAALAGALRRLLERPELRARMSARGLETARRYGWPLIVARLDEIYRGLVTGWPHGPTAPPAPAEPILEPSRA